MLPHIPELTPHIRIPPLQSLFTIHHSPISKVQASSLFTPFPGLGLAPRPSEPRSRLFPSPRSLCLPNPHVNFVQLSPGRLSRRCDVFAPPRFVPFCLHLAPPRWTSFRDPWTIQTAPTPLSQARHGPTLLMTATSPPENDGAPPSRARQVLPTIPLILSTNPRDPLPSKASPSSPTTHQLQRFTKNPSRPKPPSNGVSHKSLPPSLRPAWSR